MPTRHVDTTEEEEELNFHTKEELLYFFKWMLHVQQKYGLKEITTHGLRHTQCSLLFEAGAKIKEVQYRLDHGDVQTTLNIYAHVTKKVIVETIKKFVDYLDF